MYESQHKEVPGSPFVYDPRIDARLKEVEARVSSVRAAGKLGPDALQCIAKFFRIKNIFNSNAIEGNTLNIGETRMVVEQGLTLTGKPLKDQAEARNLNHALDYLEDLARVNRSVSETDIRQIHSLILRDVDDANAGSYRLTQVRISGSNYVPPPPENVAPSMFDFCAWLYAMTDPSPTKTTVDPVVLAATAHAWFVQIHPFVDGNGRTSRIMMNLLLMRNSYPIAIITREDRQRYYDALEESQGSDLSALIALILESIEETLEEYERAAQEQRQQMEWAASLASRLSESQRTRNANEYELWKTAMDLLLAYFRQATTTINELLRLPGNFGTIAFKEFNILDYEKYQILSQGNSAKRTWFFRLDFHSGSRTARYLFFFGFSSYEMKQFANVTLHIAREEAPFYFERLDDIPSPNVPALREIGYSISAERFYGRFGLRDCQASQLDDISRNFFEEVVKSHF